MDFNEGALVGSMKNIEASLAALEAKTEKLEIFEASTTQDLDDLKGRCSTTEKEWNDKLAALQSQLIGYESKMAELELKEQKCQAKMEELKTKDLYLEAYSRRENLIITGIPEVQDATEDTLQVLQDFMANELNVTDQLILIFSEFIAWVSLALKAREPSSLDF